MSHIVYGGARANSEVTIGERGDAVTTWAGDALDSRSSKQGCLLCRTAPAWGLCDRCLDELEPLALADPRRTLIERQGAMADKVAARLRDFHEDYVSIDPDTGKINGREDVATALLSIRNAGSRFEWTATVHGRDWSDRVWYSWTVRVIHGEAVREVGGISAALVYRGQFTQSWEWVDARAEWEAQATQAREKAVADRRNTIRDRSLVGALIAIAICLGYTFGGFAGVVAVVVGVPVVAFVGLFVFAMWEF